jgi:hypothetical protein
MHVAHSNPVLFTEWLKEYYGELKYEDLRRRSTMIKVWKDFELLELYEQLKTHKEAMWLKDIT